MKKTQKEKVLDYLIINNTITFMELLEYIEKNNIPKDVRLLSDSGWECDPTGIRAVYYDKKNNVLYLYQDKDIFGNDKRRSKAEQLKEDIYD